MRDVLSACHPAVGAAWFALVLAFPVTSIHPVLLALGLAAGLLWSARLGGKWRPGTVLLLFFSAALFNPLFSHAGATILAYFPTGNPLTLESVLYGLGTGGMLVCAAVWMGCLSRVMTADKWMCLLGRSLPILSLLLSMSLGFLPRFQRRLAQLRLALEGALFGGDHQVPGGDHRVYVQKDQCRGDDRQKGGDKFELDADAFFPAPEAGLFHKTTRFPGPA